MDSRNEMRSENEREWGEMKTTTSEIATIFWTDEICQSANSSTHMEASGGMDVNVKKIHFRQVQNSFFFFLHKIIWLGSKNFHNIYCAFQHFVWKSASLSELKRCHQFDCPNEKRIGFSFSCQSVTFTLCWKRRRPERILFLNSWQIVYFILWGGDSRNREGVSVTPTDWEVSMQYLQ